MASRPRYLVEVKVGEERAKIIARPAYPTVADAEALVRSQVRQFFPTATDASSVEIITCFRISR